MWYLIVPPFIVIFGLGALLWYMAKRMEDPAVLEKMSSLKDVVHTDAQSRSLNRKAFFLKLLEKNASRFKTNSLRLHNFFQHSLERLRAQRKNVDAIRKTVEERRVEERRKMSIDPGKKTRFFSRFGAVAIQRDDSLSVQERRAEDRRKQSLQEEKKNRFLSRLIGIKKDPSLSKETEKEFSREQVASPVSTSTSEPPVPADIPPHALPKQKSRVGNSFALAGSMVKRSLTRPDVRSGGHPLKQAEEDALLQRISGNPKDAIAYEELGDYYFTQGSMQDAKDCYRQVIKLHPTNRAVKIKIRRLEKFFENGAK